MKRLLAAAIPLVLLLPVTSSVIAENLPAANSPKHQTTNLNLNIAPQEFDFGFSGLLDADKKQRDLKQKNKWSANQNKIKLVSETYTPRQQTEAEIWNEKEENTLRRTLSWMTLGKAFPD